VATGWCRRRLGDDYDGIIVTNYLHRPLLPAIARALAPGGVLIYETFARGNERFGRPRNPDFLLGSAGKLTTGQMLPKSRCRWKNFSLGSENSPSVTNTLAASSR
jgi:SAM-dependent methyltransferase